MELFVQEVYEDLLGTKFSRKLRRMWIVRRYAKIYDALLKYRLEESVCKSTAYEKSLDLDV